MTAAGRTRTVGGILYPGFELLDLFGPLEMFGNLGPEVRIVTVAEQPGPVRSAQGPETVAEQLMQALPDDILVATPGEMVERVHAYWRQNQPVGEVFLTGLVVGFVIGVMTSFP